MVKTSDITMHRHPHIGACRAAWEPGQDLATLHLMRNCGKRILSQHCTLYVHLLMCVCKHTYAIYGVFESGPHDMSLNNPGNARVCPGLQVPMGTLVVNHSS